MSIMPLPSAWRRSAMKRSGPEGGYSFGPPCSVSRYSQITGESNRIVPSSSTKVGILPSGFSRISSRCGVMPPTTVRTVFSRSDKPISCAAIITLRT